MENRYRKIVNGHGHVMSYCHHPEISYYSASYIIVFFLTPINKENVSLFTGYSSIIKH